MSKTASIGLLPSSTLFGRLMASIDRLLTKSASIAVRNGDPSWRLPVPSRFVIDRTRIVRHVEADPDYTFRPEPEVTLDMLRKVVLD